MYLTSQIKMGGETEVPQSSPPSPPQSPPSLRRVICAGKCERPINVCLCEKIPAEPISTTTQVVILQHPHELRQKLATVPVVSKCLSDCHVIVGRKLREGSSSLLDSLYRQTRHPSIPAIFLFPGTKSTPSVDIDQWKSSLDGSCTEGCVLIVFDGTWKQAKEMMTASLPFLSKFATGVCFNCDFEVDGGCIYDSKLTLKKEPAKGCTSTIEAVARALGVLEPAGTDVEHKLIDVLRLMVQLQASYLKPTTPRPKLSKKGARKKNSDLLSQ